MHVRTPGSDRPGGTMTVITTLHGPSLDDPVPGHRRVYARDCSAGASQSDRHGWIMALRELGVVAARFRAVSVLLSGTPSSSRRPSEVWELNANRRAVSGPGPRPFGPRSGAYLYPTRTERSFVDALRKSGPVALRFLTDPQNRYITGVSLDVAGGAHLVMGS